MTDAIDILLLGGGGREHALAWKLRQSPRCGRLIAAPGNPGIAALATLAPALDMLDPDAVAAFAGEQRIGLVVVGPEAPLAAGVSDACRAAGIPVFGPSRAAAMLEASKAFTKEVCAAAGVPTAACATFDALAPALAHVRAGPLPIVVKADGLAAGKGVTVAATLPEAEAALALLFAEPGARVLVEECMVGEEVSFFVLCDGLAAVPLLAAQDHKRIGEGDSGPNTGGMGAYAPARLFTPALAEDSMARIIRPTLAEMARRGTPFSGVLFAGLMLTAEGPKLIEYNVRFGDPECQVLMMLLESDLAELLLAAAEGRLGAVDVTWKPGVAATVVVAARGYPGKPARGGMIGGLDGLPEDVLVFHAGTAIDGDRLVARGGRVLAVTAAGPTVTEAVGQANAAIEKISFADAVWRRDIGWREIERERQA